MWTVLQHTGKVVEYRTDGTILGCYPDGTNTPHFASPYTYSDFTGSSLDLGTGDKGRTRVRFSHDAAVNWKLATLRAVTPPLTSLCLRARAADSSAALEKAPWGETTCPGARRISVLNKKLDERGKLLEIEIELGSSDPTASALIYDLSVAGVP